MIKKIHYGLIKSYIYRLFFSFPEEYELMKHNCFLLSFLFTIFYYPLLAQRQELYNTSTLYELDSLKNFLEEALKEDDSLNACRAYYKLGNLYDKIGESGKSLDVFKKSLELAEALKYKKAIANISNSLASGYGRQSRSDDAIKLYKHVFCLFKELKDTSAMAAVQMNIGTEYIEKGEFTKALEMEIGALRLKEPYGDSSNLAYYYQSLAGLFYSLKDFDKWKEYLFAASKLAENPQYANEFTRIEILNEMGEYYRKQNNFIEAEKCFNNIYSLSVESDYQNGKGIALTNLVPIYIQNKDYKKAEWAVQESISLNKKTGQMSSTIYNLVQLGSLNRSLKNYKKAEQYLNKGVELALKYNSPEDRLKALDELYLLKKDQKENSEALGYYEMYVEVKDSLLDIETKRQIAKVEAVFQTKKKEQQIKILNKENILQKQELKIKQQTIFIISSLSLLFIAGGFFFYRTKETNTELKALQAEHKMLRSQMNPHFIFNSLMAIQNYLLTHEPLQTSDYLSEFASLMRMILSSSRADTILLKNELEINSYYLKLQKMRFNDKFDYLIIVDEKLDDELINIPPMLTQPFIENAVEHGIKKLENDGGLIKISYEKNDCCLIIKIKDNGPGFAEANDRKKEDHVSYAMRITKERIETIKKIHKIEISMNISGLPENEKGTLVELKIPFINN